MNKELKAKQPPQLRGDNIILQQTIPKLIKLRYLCFTALWLKKIIPLGLHVFSQGGDAIAL